MISQAQRPVIFKWRHFEPAIILCAVRWYLRYSLSYRDVEELMTERGVQADHTTIWRWVQRYSPELNKRCRRELRQTNGSWRVDETYIPVAGGWNYLYRAVDSTGATGPIKRSKYEKYMFSEHRIRTMEDAYFGFISSSLRRKFFVQASPLWSKDDVAKPCKNGLKT